MYPVFVKSGIETSVAQPEYNLAFIYNNSKAKFRKIYQYICGQECNPIFHKNDVFTKLEIRIQKHTKIYICSITQF